MRIRVEAISEEYLVAVHREQGVDPSTRHTHADAATTNSRDMQ